MDVVPGDPVAAADKRMAAFEAEFIGWLEQPDDFAARELLAAGLPVYYIDDDTPRGLVIKEYPDGRRQLVSGAGVSQTVVRGL